MVWLALLADVHDVVHWPTRGGYNFVSGPLADVTLLTAFGSAMVFWWRRHQCHIPGCWRLQWHPHPAHGHPVCRKHHPDFGTVGASSRYDERHQLRTSDTDHRAPSTRHEVSSTDGVR